MSQTHQSVTVVIPCFNEVVHVDRCIRSVLANQYPNVAIIVVDDQSTDGSYEKLLKMASPTVSIHRNPSRLGPAESRNVGLRNAQADIVFFTDADCEVASDWIWQGVRALADDEHLYGIEGVIEYPFSAPSMRYALPVNPFYHVLPTKRLNMPGRDFATGNICYRRDVLSRVGGFRSDKFPFGREDTDLGWRISKLGRIKYNPRMRVMHNAEEWSLKTLLINANRYSGDVNLWIEHGQFLFKAGPILHPRFLLLMFMPILMPLFYPVRSWRDFWFLAKLWVYLLRLRLVIWQRAYEVKRFTL